MQEEGQLITIPFSDPRWMQLLQACPKATIFHHPAWIELISDCYGYASFILALSDGRGGLCAGLPVINVVSPLTGRRWVSLPFSDYCQPLSRDEEALQELCRGLISFHQAGRFKKMEVRWRLPTRPDIQQGTEWVLHRLRLDPDPERVAQKFKRTHLQNIRASETRGVQVEMGNGLDQMKIFYDLQVETRKRHGVPVQPWKYFERLQDRLLARGLGFSLLARKDDRPIAGMVFLAWQKTLIAKYAASLEDSFNLRPNNLLYWEGMKWGCRNGYEIFDMGRTELQNAGLRNFKSRWGAVEEPLYYSSISSGRSPSPFGRLERVLHSVIRNSPLWVCRLSGNLLYRHFG